MKHIALYTCCTFWHNLPITTCLVFVCHFYVEQRVVPFHPKAVPFCLCVSRTVSPIDFVLLKNKRSESVWSLLLEVVRKREKSLVSLTLKVHGQSFNVFSLNKFHHSKKGATSRKVFSHGSNLPITARKEFSSYRQSTTLSHLHVSTTGLGLWWNTSPVSWLDSTSSRVRA